MLPPRWRRATAERQHRSLPSREQSHLGWQGSAGRPGTRRGSAGSPLPGPRRPRAAAHRQPPPSNGHPPCRPARSRRPGPPVGRTRGTIWWPSSLSWLELQTCSPPEQLWKQRRSSAAPHSASSLQPRPGRGGARARARGCVRVGGGGRRGPSREVPSPRPLRRWTTRGRGSDETPPTNAQVGRAVVLGTPPSAPEPEPENGYRQRNTSVNVSYANPREIIMDIR